MTASRNSGPEFQPAIPGPVPATSEPAGRGGSSDVGIPTSSDGKVWAVLGLASGAAVSVAANVLHSFIHPDGAPKDWHPQLGSVFGAVWWPLSLLLAVEVLASGRWGSARRWVLARVVMVSPVAAVAAVVSYHHLSGLLASWGEDGFTVRFGPVAVDGLMMVCSAALYRARLAAGEPGVSRQAVSPEPAGEPGEPVQGRFTEPLGWLTEPADWAEPGRLGEPASPAGEPLGEPGAESPSEAPAEPARLGSVSPIRRPPRPARKPAGNGLQECGCGLEYCPGSVPKSTRTAHYRRVREATEQAERARSNGHREPISAR